MRRSSASLAQRTASTTTPAEFGLSQTSSFSSRLSGMPPKLQSDDGRHVVIRPLAYMKEADIAAYAEAMAFPIIPCTLCGSQENLQRKVVRRMLEAWEKESPGRLETISRALGDVRPSQLSDRRLFDFLALGRRGEGPLPDLQAWMAGSSATIAGDATDEADDGAAPSPPNPDALAPLRARTFDPIWNP